MKSKRDLFFTTLLKHKLILLPSLLFFGSMEVLVVHQLELELSTRTDLFNQAETFYSRTILVGIDVINPLNYSLSDHNCVTVIVN